MTALGAAGINAADVNATPLNPSAQDYYLDEWQTEGPGGAGTDAARGILTGIAGGIQPSRISRLDGCDESNLVARLAELWDGTQLGSAGCSTTTYSACSPCTRPGAPPEMLRQIVDYLRTKHLPDGGWSWNTAPDARPTPT